MIPDDRAYGDVVFGEFGVGPYPAKVVAKDGKAQQGKQANPQAGEATQERQRITTERWRKVIQPKHPTRPRREHRTHNRFSLGGEGS